MDEKLKLNLCPGREKLKLKGCELRASAPMERERTWSRRAEMCVGVSKETRIGPNLPKVAGKTKEGIALDALD